MTWTLCHDQESHGRHEWIDGVMRRDCPGVSPEPRELDSVDRKVLTILYRGVEAAYRPARYDWDEDDE